MAEALIEILKVRGETALGTPQPSATRPTSKMEKPKKPHKPGFDSS
jgi:hypothetical protein